MKATFRNKKKDSDVKIYALTGTDAELKAYAKIKGANLRKEEDGTPLYFTQRALAANVEYKLESDGTLSGGASRAQSIMDALSQVQGASLNDLQKYAAMNQAGLL